MFVGNKPKLLSDPLSVSLHYVLTYNVFHRLCSDCGQYYNPKLTTCSIDRDLWQLYPIGVTNLKDGW